MKKFNQYYVMAIVPVILLLLIAGYFQQFILYVIQTNVTLNAVIILAWLIGVLTLLARIRKVGREAQVLGLFQANSEAGEEIQPLLNDPLVQSSSLGRMMSHVAEREGKLTSRMQQADIETEMTVLQVRFETEYELPNFLVGLLIGLGLLGTFIGLLETLQGISHILNGLNGATAGAELDKAFLDIVSKLREPLSGMGTAFSASMFGLVGSLSLGMMLLSFKRCGNDFIAALRDYLGKVTEYAESPSGLGAAARQGVSEAFLTDFVANLVEQQRSAQEIFYQGQDSNLKLGMKMDRIMEQFGEVAGLLSAQVETSKRTNDLISYGPRMRDLAEQQLSESQQLTSVQREQVAGIAALQGAIERVEQRNVLVYETLARSQEFANTNAQSMKEMVTDIRAGISDVIKEGGQSRQVQIDIAKHLAEQNKRSSDIANSLANLEKLGTDNTTQFEGLTQILDAHAANSKRAFELMGFGPRMRDLAEQQLVEVQQLATAHREQVASMAALQSELVREGSQSRQLQLDIAKHLAEQNKRSQEIAASLEALEKAGTDNTGQFELIAKTLEVHAESSKRAFELMGFGPRMRDLAEQQLTELRQVGSVQQDQVNGIGAMQGSIEQLLQRNVQIHETLERQQSSTVDVIQTLAEMLAGLRSGLGDLLKENSQSRQVQIDIARHLTEQNVRAQNMLNALAVLEKLEQTSTSQVGVSEMLLNEVRASKATMVRDIRNEIRELARAIESIR